MKIQELALVTLFYFTDYTEDNHLLKTKYFIGGNYEKEEDAEGKRKLHHLSASTGLFGILVQENEGEQMYYIHKLVLQGGEDYLCSFQSITKEVEVSNSPNF